MKRSRRSASTAAAAAAAAAPADSSPAADSDARAYNSQGYWDARYVQHLARQAADSGAGSSVAAAPPAAPAGPSALGAESDDVTAEWYYSLEDLEPILLPALSRLDRSQRVLDVGCGLSSVFPSLRSWGFTGAMVGLDYSPTVVAHMRSQHPPQKDEDVHWVCGDACHLLDGDEAEEKQQQGNKRKKQRKSAGSDSASSSSSSSSSPPPLSPSERALFTPESYCLILDKATSDGMLCSPETALLTPHIYANVARLLAPNGLFVVASVNEPESGWFAEYVLAQLLQHGGDEVQWNIEVHTPENYKDGEEGAPNVYLIRKHVAGVDARRADGRSVRSSTAAQRELYTIKQFSY